MILLSSILLSANNVETRFEKDCEKGDVLYCSLIASKAQKDNPERAIKYYRKACDLGKSCSMLGVMLIEKKKFKEAVIVLKKGCKDNDAMSCNLSGVLALEDHDLLSAANYLEKACDLDHGKSCAMVGEQYFKGTGVERDRGKGVAFVKKACELKFEAGCKIYDSVKVYE